MLNFSISGRDRKMVVKFISLYVSEDERVQLLATLSMPGLKGKAACVFDYDEGVLTTTLINQVNWKQFPVLTESGWKDCIPPQGLTRMFKEIKQLVVRDLKMSVDYSDLFWCAGVEEVFAGCEPLNF